MFGWTADEKRSFVFYADRETSKFVPEDQIVELSAQAAFPSLAYLDPLGRPVTINLGVSEKIVGGLRYCLLYTSPSPRDGLLSRMPSSA